MKLLLSGIITFILSDYGSPQENAELFQCQPSSEIRGQIFFPNIPDFYFNEQNASAFTTGQNANLTTLSEFTTYIFTIPPRDCSGNFTTLQYCYLINTTRVQDSRFALYYTTRSNMTFTITPSILFAPSASDEDCTTLSADLRICCEVQQINNFSIPSSEYSYGFASRSMQLLSFSDQATAFHALRLDATIFTEEGGRATLRFSGNIIPQRPIALLRFLKGAAREESENTSPEFKSGTTTILSRSSTTSESINVSLALDTTTADKNDINGTPLRLIIGGTTAGVVISLLCVFIGGLILVHKLRGRKRVKSLLFHTSLQELTRGTEDSACNTTYYPGEILTSNDVPDNKDPQNTSISSEDNLVYAAPHVVGKLCTTEKVTASIAPTKDNVSYDIAPAAGKINTSENIAYSTASTTTGLQTKDNVAYNVAPVEEKMHTSAYNMAPVAGELHTSENVAYNVGPVARKAQTSACNKTNAAGISTRDNIAYNKATERIHIKENVAYSKTESILTERNVAYTTNYVAADSILMDTNECHNAGEVSCTIDYSQQYDTPLVDDVTSDTQQLVYDYVMP